MILLPGRWKARQYATVIDKFKSVCPSGAWDDSLIRYAVLIEHGPACGPRIAKKLKASKDIWELLGHADNCQPRWLFYFDQREPLITFVHAYIKRAKGDIQKATELAQRRRKLIERGEKPTSAITSIRAVVH